MRIFFPLFFLLASSFGQTLTNDAQGYSGSLVSSVPTAAFANNLTNPSRIGVMCGSGDSTGGIVTTVTDTAMNTYTDSGYGVCVAATGYYFDAPNFQFFLASNTSTTASNIATCHFSFASQTARAEAFELTGTQAIPDGYSCTDLLTAVSSGPNAMVFNTLTPSSNGNFIYLAGFTPQGGASGFSAGTSPIMWTIMPYTITAFVSEYYVQSTAASIGPTEGFSTGSNVLYGGFAVALCTSNCNTNRHQQPITIGPN